MCATALQCEVLVDAPSQVAFTGDAVSPSSYVSFVPAPPASSGTGTCQGAMAALRLQFQRHGNFGIQAGLAFTVIITLHSLGLLLPSPFMGP